MLSFKEWLRKTEQVQEEVGAVNNPPAIIQPASPSEVRRTKEDPVAAILRSLPKSGIPKPATDTPAPAPTKKSKNAPQSIDDLIKRDHEAEKREHEFQEFLRRTHRLEDESGKGIVTHDTGGETKFGISKRAHPGEDVKNITKERANEIYRKEYFDRLGPLPQHSPKARAIIYDAAVHHGPKFASDIAKQHGNDIDALLKARQDHYDFLVANNPEHARREKGYKNRLIKLQRDIMHLDEKP